MKKIRRFTRCPRCNRPVQIEDNICPYCKGLVQYFSLEKNM